MLRIFIFFTFVGIAFGAGSSPFCMKSCDCSEVVPGPHVDCSKTYLKIDALFDPANYLDQSTNETYNIYELSFQTQAIGDLTKIFPLSPLKILDLSRTSLRTITPGAFKNLEDMEELILSYNNLQNLTQDALMGLRLDGSDYPLKSLKTLSLDHNNFHSLSSDLFQHIDRRIERIFLNGNPFTVIDQSTLIAINSLVFMKELDLSNCQLTHLPDHFLHTPQYLETLNLSYNNISSIHELDLEEARALTTLIIDGNPIVNMSDVNVFPNVTTLKVLHLCDMPVLEVIGNHSLCGLTQLEELYIMNNPKLVEIAAQAVTRIEEGSEVPVITKIKKLNLRNNELAHLDLQIDYGKLEYLNILFNPWTCECENQWIIDTLIPIYHGLDAKAAESMMCAAPVEMEGKSLYELGQSKYIMRCLDIHGAHPEKDGLLLVYLLLGLLLGIVIVLFIFYARQRYWFGIFDKSPASYSRQFYGRTRSMDEDNELA